MNQPKYNQHTIIFTGALWSQWKQWQGVTRSLPANTCLLIFDNKNQKHTRLMGKVSQFFKDKGRPVRWLNPISRRNVAYHSP